MWPDSNGGEQMAALKITLHRMRQLLGVKNVILQTAKCLTLNPRVCQEEPWSFAYRDRLEKLYRLLNAAGV